MFSNMLVLCFSVGSINGITLCTHTHVAFALSSNPTPQIICLSFHGRFLGEPESAIPVGFLPSSVHLFRTDPLGINDTRLPISTNQQCQSTEGNSTHWLQLASSSLCPPLDSWRMAVGPFIPVLNSTFILSIFLWRLQVRPGPYEFSKLTSQDSWVACVYKPDAQTVA